jgi:hypothetical protein
MFLHNTSGLVLLSVSGVKILYLLFCGCVASRQRLRVLFSKKRTTARAHRLFEADLLQVCPVGRALAVKLRIQYIRTEKFFFLCAREQAIVGKLCIDVCQDLISVWSADLVTRFKLA